MILQINAAFALQDHRLQLRCPLSAHSGDDSAGGGVQVQKRRRIYARNMTHKIVGAICTKMCVADALHPSCLCKIRRNAPRATRRAVAAVYLRPIIHVHQGATQPRPRNFLSFRAIDPFNRAAVIASTDNEQISLVVWRSGLSRCFLYPKLYFYDSKVRRPKPSYHRHMYPGK